MRQILRLSVFDDVFRDCMSEARVDSVDLVLAIETEHEGICTAAFLELVERCLVGNPHRSQLLREFGARVHMIDFLWQVARASESIWTKETTSDLEFGMAAPVRTAQAVAKQEAKLTSPTKSRGTCSREQSWKARVFGKRRKILPGPESLGSAPSLKRNERDAKAKWVARIGMIKARAGEAAKLGHEFDQDSKLFLPGAPARLEEIVLGAGSFRTLRMNVLIWEKFEKWIRQAGGSPFPPTIKELLAYVHHLDMEECGPSVSPTFRACVGWICQRLAMSAPDLKSPTLLALEKDIVDRRGKELREAVPLHLDVVRALEFAVVMYAKMGKQTRAVFVWWLLCLIWGSLRFNDGLHVAPSTLEMIDQGLAGVAWQTKVERKRGGTKFVIMAAGFSGQPWLTTGWDEYQELLTDELKEIDFWMFELRSLDSMMLDRPLAYHTFRRAAPEAMMEAIDMVRRDGQIQVTEKMVESVHKFTGHSPRVTMLDAMAHHGSGDQPMMIQANWKDGAMPLKYIRNRKTLALKYLFRMTKDVRRGWRPGVGASVIASTLSQEIRNDEVRDSPTSSGVESNDDVARESSDEEINGNDPAAPVFYQSYKAFMADVAYEYKIHVTAFDNPGVLACRNIKIEDCVLLGGILPDRSALCLACSRCRPDV